MNYFSLRMFSAITAFMFLIGASAVPFPARADEFSQTSAVLEASIEPSQETEPVSQPESGSENPAEEGVEDENDNDSESPEPSPEIPSSAEEGLNSSENETPTQEASPEEPTDQTTDTEESNNTSDEPALEPESSQTGGGNEPVFFKANALVTADLTCESPQALYTVPTYTPQYFYENPTFLIPATIPSPPGIATTQGGAYLSFWRSGQQVTCHYNGTDSGNEWAFDICATNYFDADNQSITSDVAGSSVTSTDVSFDAYDPVSGLVMTSGASFEFCGTPTAVSPTPTADPSPSVSPTASPTVEPTSTPTATPTTTPTAEPSPTIIPTPGVCSDGQASTLLVSSIIENFDPAESFILPILIPVPTGIDGTNVSLINFYRGDDLIVCEYLGSPEGINWTFDKCYLNYLSSNQDTLPTTVTEDKGGDTVSTQEIYFQVFASGGTLLSSDPTANMTICSPAAATPTPTATPTVSPDPSASPTVSPDPSASPTVSPDPSASPTVTPDPSATPTVSPTPSPSVSVSPTATPTPTPDPSVTPTVTPEPTATPTATPTPTPETTPVARGSSGGGGGGRAFCANPPVLSEITPVKNGTYRSLPDIGFTVSDDAATIEVKVNGQAIEFERSEQNGFIRVNADTADINTPDGKTLIDIKASAARPLCWKHATYTITVDPSARTTDEGRSIGESGFEQGEAGQLFSDTDAFEALQKSGLIGTDKKPMQNLTRVVAAEIIFGILKLQAMEKVSNNPFPDVPKSRKFAPFVAALKEQGILKGFGDGMFRPGKAITRAEGYKMLYLSSGRSLASGDAQCKDLQIGAWYLPFMKSAAAHDLLLSGSESLCRPNQVITLAEFAELVIRFFPQS